MNSDKARAAAENLSQSWGKAIFISLPMLLLSLVMGNRSGTDHRR